MFDILSDVKGIDYVLFEDRDTPVRSFLFILIEGLMALIGIASLVFVIS